MIIMKRDEEVGAIEVAEEDTKAAGEVMVNQGEERAEVAEEVME